MGGERQEKRGSFQMYACLLLGQKRGLQFCEHGAGMLILVMVFPEASPALSLLALHPTPLPSPSLPHLSAPFTLPAHTQMRRAHAFTVVSDHLLRGAPLPCGGLHVVDALDVTAHPLQPRTNPLQVRFWLT